MSPTPFDLDEIEPWTDPDNPDPVLDAAYRAGITPEAERWSSGFTYRPIELPDAVTILRAVDDKRLAKVVRCVSPPDIADYDRPFRFNMARRHVRHLDDIAGMLAWLSGQKDRCIVRGDIIGPDKNVRRLVHQVGDDAPTLKEAPRRWVAIDMDCPPDPRGELIDTAKVGVALLPPEFHGRECLCQATASHGIKPGLRIRLWFWLSRAVGRDELEYWFRDAPVDKSIFAPSQITYTAAPIFVNGAIEPVHERMVRLAGGGEVQVPDVLKPEPRAQQQKQAPRAEIGLSPYAEAALDSACRKIIFAPSGEQEATLNGEAFAIGTLAGAGAIPEEFARRTLIWAAQRVASHDPHDPWLASELQAKVGRAFAAGVRRPREVRL